MLKCSLNRLVKTIVTGIMCKHFLLLKFLKRKFKRNIKSCYWLPARLQLRFLFPFFKKKSELLMRCPLDTKEHKCRKMDKNKVLVHCNYRAEQRDRQSFLDKQATVLWAFCLLSSSTAENRVAFKITAVIASTEMRENTFADIWRGKGAIGTTETEIEFSVSCVQIQVVCFVASNNKDFSVLPFPLFN